jgi:hypothetical protein
VNELAWRQGLKTSQEARYQGAEGSDPVRRCDEHDDGDREGTPILLMFQILIGRQEGVELTGRELQQLAVSDARPAHCGNGANFVLGSSRASGRGNDSSGSMRTGGQEISGEFESNDRLFPSHGGEVLEELIQGVPGGEVV